MKKLNVTCFANIPQEGFFVFKENLIQVAVQPVEMEIAQEMFLPKVVI